MANILLKVVHMRILLRMQRCCKKVENYNQNYHKALHMYIDIYVYKYQDVYRAFNTLTMRVYYKPLGAAFIRVHCRLNVKFSTVDMPDDRTCKPDHV